APELTTGELTDAIAKLAIALDPQWVRRRYEQALLRRRVVGRRNPDGTATLAGYELPPAAGAPACPRLGDPAQAAKARGHPGRLRPPRRRPARGDGPRGEHGDERPADRRRPAAPRPRQARHRQPRR